MSVIAIDPGNEQSAFLILHPHVGSFGIVHNDNMIDWIRRWSLGGAGDHLAIEMIASYGMPVGREVFETCVMIGRFIEAWGRPYTLVYRRDVKMHLCGNNAAKDGNIRAALIDRFGPGKAKAVGTIKAKGPLYGISNDVWSALAVAVTWSDTHAREASAA
jgi:hypothetical protein